MGWVFLCLGVVWCWALCLLWMSSEQVFLSRCFVVNGAGKYFLTVKGKRKWNVPGLCVAVSEVKLSRSSQMHGAWMCVRQFASMIESSLQVFLPTHPL